MGTIHDLEAQRRLLAERNRLRDRALREAHALRNEALGELFRDVATWLGHAADRTRRSADRLAARLRQHAKQRAAASGSLGA